MFLCPCLHLSSIFFFLPTPPSLFLFFLKIWGLFSKSSHLVGERDYKNKQPTILLSSFLQLADWGREKVSPLTMVDKLSKPTMSHVYVYRFCFLWRFGFLYLEYTSTPLAHLANSYSSFKTFLRHHLLWDVFLGCCFWPNSVISLFYVISILCTYVYCWFCYNLIFTLL